MLLLCLAASQGSGTEVKLVGLGRSLAWPPCPAHARGCSPALGSCLSCQLLAMVAACVEKGDPGRRVAMDPGGVHAHPKRGQGLEQGEKLGVPRAAPSRCISLLHTHLRQVPGQVGASKSQARPVLLAQGGLRAVGCSGESLMCHCGAALGW